MASLARVGIAIGHSTDAAGATGVTVIRAIDGPVRAGVAVFGRATGTRDLLTASPTHLVEGRIDAVMLTGGSAFGLDAAAGVMRWMEERGRGFSVGAGVVPIVPAAVVFDLVPLGHPDARPTAAMAYEAANVAREDDVAEGSVGAGAGATVGKALGAAGAMKGGFGCAVVESADAALSVAAAVVVNAFGDVRDASGSIIAGARSSSGGFVDTTRMLQDAEGAGARPSAPIVASLEETAMRNTTIAVVAASTPLSAIELSQLAHAAGAALFKRITPTATSFDGDVVFALSPLTGERLTTPAVVVEALATLALEQAIERAVRLAKGRDGIPGLADGHGD